MIDDIQPREARAGGEPQGNHAGNRAGPDGDLPFRQAELIRNRGGNAFHDGEGGVNGQRAEAEVEDKGEDRVENAAVRKVDDRHRIDHERRTDTGGAHVGGRHARAVHGSEEHNAGKNADREVGKGDDNRVERDIGVAVDERAVSDHDRHHDRERIEHLPDGLHPEVWIGKRAEIRHEQRADSLHGAGHCKALYGHNQKAEHRQEHRVFHDLADAACAVADAQIDEGPRKDQAAYNRHGNRAVAACGAGGSDQLRPNAGGGLAVAGERCKLKGTDRHQDDPCENDRVVDFDKERIGGCRPAERLKFAVHAA